MVLYCCWQWTPCLHSRVQDVSYFRHCDLRNSDTSGNVCISCILNIMKVINSRHLRLLPGHAYFQILISVSANCWYVTGLHVLDSCSCNCKLVSWCDGRTSAPTGVRVASATKLFALSWGFYGGWLCVHILHVKKKKCALVFTWGKEMTVFMLPVSARYC